MFCWKTVSRSQAVEDTKFLAVLWRPFVCALCFVREIYSACIFRVSQSLWELETSLKQSLSLAHVSLGMAAWCGSTSKAAFMVQLWVWSEARCAREKLEHTQGEQCEWGYGHLERGATGSVILEVRVVLGWEREGDDGRTDWEILITIW